VEGVAEETEQESKLSVWCHGVLTRVGGPVLVVEPLAQIGLACGVMACVRRLILLGHGRRRCALQLTASVTEVLQRMTPVTPPARVWARRVLASHQATAPLGGHAEAVEARLAPVVTMGVPGLGRALRGQVHLQHGRAVRRKRAQAGLMAGKHRIAQRKHHGALGHRQGRRSCSPVVLEACTEIPHGVRLVWDILSERGQTRQ
jgi:hypothetical protein